MKRLIGFWQVHFLGVELVAAGILTGVLILWIEAFDRYGSVEEILRDNRTALYGVMASIFGSLLGFAITTTAIIIGFAQSPQLEVVRRSTHYPTLWKVLTSTIRWLGVALVVSIVAFVLDRDDDSVQLLSYVFVATGLVAGLRLARTVWVLENVIALITRNRESTRDSDDDPPTG